MFPDLEFIKTCLNGLRSRIEKVENGLLKRIEKVEDWAVSEDQVTQTVADYFVKNPIVESDPTVPAWAKEPTKPTYTAKEIGAQPDMYVGNFDSVLRELAEKNVVYVAYQGSASPIPSGRYPVLLMRSGIDRGQASIVAYDAAGKTWAGGANFVQGTIGLVERTLTASDIGAIPAPATASVGQAIVVKAVDENGKPTEWEAVDRGSSGGGGGSSQWKIIRDLTITENADRVDISTDDAGEAFSLHEIQVFSYTKSYEDTAESFTFLMNGYWGSSDPYFQSGFKSTKSSDNYYSGNHFIAMMQNGIANVFQPWKQYIVNSSTGGDIFSIGDKYQAIESVSFVGKFIAGCRFILIGRVSL